VTGAGLDMQILLTHQVRKSSFVVDYGQFMAP
jgi:hypothetical protein